MNNVADKLYNILGTKFDNTDIKTLDSSGKETTDMEEIEMFSFDFLVNSKNYGPVVILLSANENLEVYYGDNTSKSLDTDAKKKWENLIEHLSTFARTNRLGFSLKHTSDLKYDLSNITDITESYRNIFEGYYGTKKTSYSPQGKAKIIIKHSKAIGEDDKRFRNISSLFIENADGERFKLPFKKLAGARAMARHVTEGGNPYDLFGVHISEMVNDINTLGGFVRRSKMYEGNDDAMTMVETGRTHYNEMRKSLKRIAGVRGYGTYKESWEPSEITEQETDTTAIRKLFTEKKVNPRTEDALPLLARLQQMAEAKSKIEWPEEVKGRHPDEDNWGDDREDDDYDWERHPDEPDDIDETRKKMSDKHQADSFAARTKWKKETDAEEARQEKAFRDPKMTWSKYAKGTDEVEEGEYENQIAARNKLASQHEPKTSQPSEVEVYSKIKDWDGTALRGYARRVGLPADAFTAQSDEDTMIDELMGFLFDDDWEMKLIKAGAFNESDEDDKYPDDGWDDESADYDHNPDEDEDMLGSTLNMYYTPPADKIDEPTKDNDMKEINEFEEWADKIVEGTWSFPDSPDTRQEVKAFMATEQPLGIDAMNAKDALYDLIGNDDLFDELADIAKKDPDADARPAVKNYIETMYRDLDQYAEEDHPNIIELYKAIGGEAVYPHEMEEGCDDLDYDGDTTQLNASANKHVDDYIQKEDVVVEADDNQCPHCDGTGEVDDGNWYNKKPCKACDGTGKIQDDGKEELDEAALSFGIDGNGPYNVMSSKGDIHDTYDSKEEAQRVAKELNAKHKDKVNESDDEKECKWCGNTFPADKLAAHEETCDYVIPKDLTKDKVTESEDLKTLMQRTNFLLSNK